MQVYLKAIYAAAVAVLASLNAAYIAQHHIGLAAGLAAAGSGLAAFGVVWGVPNAAKAKAAAPAPPSPAE